jgi:hypothetical protein
MRMHSLSKQTTREGLYGCTEIGDQRSHRSQFTCNNLMAQTRSAHQSPPGPPLPGSLFGSHPVWSNPARHFPTRALPHIPLLARALHPLTDARPDLSSLHTTLDPKYIQSDLCVGRSRFSRTGDACCLVTSGPHVVPQRGPQNVPVPSRSSTQLSPGT